MKPNYKIHTKILLAVCLLFTMNAAAKNFSSRAETWEFFLAPQFTNSKLLQFDNGAEANINETSSLSFGLGYNMNSQTELSVLFTNSDTNYSGKRIIDDGSNTPEKFTANLLTSSINFGLTYNLFKTAFTPYISTHLGWSFIDSGIPTGSITGNCWWDPWWGYTCSSRAETFTTTELNYGAGLGLRFDVNQSFYLKGGVSKNYIDLNSSNTADFTTYQFIFGFKF